MKVQRSVSRQLGGKEYVKHQIVIPNNIMVQLRWIRGDQLEARINTKGLLLYKVERKLQRKALDYESFKEAVTRVLTALPKGCAWSELRQKADLPQLTPSPIWVIRMENEKCLERIRDPVTSQVFWRLGESASTPRTLNGWITNYDC